MEIKINVDEGKFKEVIESELNAFSKEELHEIIRNCIIEAFRNNPVIESICFKPERNYYGRYEPSEVLIQAAKSIDLSPAYKEIQENMITTLKNDYHRILEKAMMGLILNGISNDYDFQGRMHEAILSIINNVNNN